MIDFDDVLLPAPLAAEFPEAPRAAAGPRDSAPRPANSDSVSSTT
jgi:hypothetical protein